MYYDGRDVHYGGKENVKQSDADREHQGRSE